MSRKFRDAWDWLLIWFWVILGYAALWLLFASVGFLSGCAVKRGTTVHSDEPCWVLYRCSPGVQAAAKACVDKGEVPYYRHDWKGLVNEVVCFPKEGR